MSTIKQSPVKDLLKNEIASLTYKPGWSFAVETYMGLGLTDEIIALAIKADAICVDSGQPITINRSFPVPDALYEYRRVAENLPRAFIVNCIEQI